MKEIRIYHEVLEQAAHFIKPAITRAIGPHIPIKLVRLTGVRPTSSVIAASLAAGLGLKDPDALVTFIDDAGVELPLLVMEFSAAVETQDHDLQRFDAMVAAGMFRAPFCKIYAKRKSTSDHGGQKTYDRSLAYRLLTIRHATPAFEVEWPLTDPYTADRDPLYLACPPRSGDFDSLIAILCDLARRKLDLCSSLFAKPSLLPPRLKQQLIDCQVSLAPPVLGPGRSTRFFRQGNDLVLKFNRWGHAMDPERGMSWYLRELWGTRLVGRLEDRDASTTAEALAHLCRATGLGRGTQIAVTNAHVVDISKAVEASQLNRPGLAIFYNCRRFQVTDASKKVLLDVVWTVEPNLRAMMQTAKATSLVPRRKLTEDDVTYVTAYQVLRPNGFNIVSVSYPGDQGDFPIVSGSGRANLRRYIDVVALKPKVALDLTESKGSYNIADVTQAVEAVLEFRDDPVKRQLLVKTFSRRVNIDTDEILASVAFVDAPMKTTPARLNDLDFFVSITHTSWKVWTHRRDLPLTITSGTVDLPETWSY